MRSQIKVQVHRSARPSSGTAGPTSPCRRPQARSGRRRPAIWQGLPRGGRRPGDRLRQAPAPRSGQLGRATPPFPLTLPAMQGSRHPLRRGSGRPAFALLSVLALLAMACFPVLANAEDSSNYQYETAVPSPTGHSATPTGGGGGTKSPNSGGGSPTAHASGRPSGSGSSPSGSSANGNPTTGSDGGTGHGSQGNGSTTSQHASKGQDSAGTLGGPKPVSSTTATSDGGGSSPLIPILIAIAVLAAISVGVVLYRQRRQGPGSSVSPKAS